MSNLLIFKKGKIYLLLINISLLALTLNSCNISTSEKSKRSTEEITSKKYQTLNVKNFEAKGDGIVDDTKPIQAAINAAKNGDTVLIPEGHFKVQTLILKSDISIKGVGLLKQYLAADTQNYSRRIQNSSTPLFFGRNLKNVSLNFRAETRNEALYISKSNHIKISYTNIKGNAKKIKSFPALLFYECNSIQIDHSNVSGYGSPRLSAKTYQAGTAIRLLSCTNITIEGNKLQYNGENGIFMHGSSSALINNNLISHNGMSAIQIGFGKTKKERDFIISNNILEHNAADAIDINNKITPAPLVIDCFIKNNKSFHNGFVNGESTVDGSGLATLVNVSGVTITDNESNKSNRPALYLDNCGDIIAKHNKSDNKVEIVNGFNKITLQENVFDAITILAHVKGKSLHAIGNEMRTLLLPNSISIDSLVLQENKLMNASLNINMQGNLLMNKNIINSNAPSGAILLVNINSAQLDQNQIKSTRFYAITIRKMAKKVNLRHNVIQSVDACIYDEGAENLTLFRNKLHSISGGKLNRTFISKNPNHLKMKQNEHVGGKSDNSIRFEGTGIAFLSKEKIISGYPDYGKVVIKKF
ncbi:right-handed parallel beta-helix repeat-containing protein [Olivibacter domesticus]|uniref:Parallel beta-helix repeat (Two copies) n=1 Tax=Olivibacter domesticus TaxID=407022 RepID=A0A1H7YUN1_OLID1|nr:right-handed parallel beta-helix repeat-containing protein [Olivibacter domesticus]SEM49574.1 parallel beta-helix repeat (two copies) [Olivibacter domesticus]